jgi:hypothetical protein
MGWSSQTILRRELASITASRRRPRVNRELLNLPYALSRLARQGDWLFDFEGQRRGYRRTVPLTETIDLWQATR